MYVVIDGKPRNVKEGKDGKFFYVKDGKRVYTNKSIKSGKKPELEISNIYDVYGNVYYDNGNGNKVSYVKALSKIIDNRILISFNDYINLFMMKKEDLEKLWQFKDNRDNSIDIQYIEFYKIIEEMIKLDDANYTKLKEVIREFNREISGDNCKDLIDEIIKTEENKELKEIIRSLFNYITLDGAICCKLLGETSEQVGGLHQYYYNYHKYRKLYK